MSADFFDYAYNHEIYRPQQLELPIIIEGRAGDNSKTTIAITDIKKPKIICYARPVTPRRCFELIVHGLKELYGRGLDFYLSFFGWDLAPYFLPFQFRNLRILTHEDLAKLYNWADLGVVFSPTNYSLLSHEMMACKLPVLEMKGPTIETIFKDGYNITLAEPNPISIADKMDYLLRNPDKRREIAENARQYVRQFSWEKSAKKVEAILKRELP
jgi:glycosyltransferase involved in cell wall biosynthesis